MCYIHLNCNYITYEINLTELDSYNVDYGYTVHSKNLNCQNLFIQHCPKNYYLDDICLDNTEYEEENESICNDHSLYDSLLNHYNKPLVFYKTFLLNIFKLMYYFLDSIIILHQVFMI